MNRGFITEADTETTTYRGHRITIGSARVTVHDDEGGTRAEFASMPAARRFICRLRGERS